MLRFTLLISIVLVVGTAGCNQVQEIDTKDLSTSLAQYEDEAEEQARLNGQLRTEIETLRRELSGLRPDIHVHQLETPEPTLSEESVVTAVLATIEAVRVSESVSSQFQTQVPTSSGESHKSQSESSPSGQESIPVDTTTPTPVLIPEPTVEASSSDPSEILTELPGHEKQVFANILFNSGRNVYSGDGGLASDAQYARIQPMLAVDSLGTWYFLDFRADNDGNTSDWVIRAVFPNGVVMRVAGGGRGVPANGADARSVQFFFIDSLAIDTDGRLIFTAHHGTGSTPVNTEGVGSVTSIWKIGEGYELELVGFGTSSEFCNAFKSSLEWDSCHFQDADDSLVNPPYYSSLAATDDHLVIGPDSSQHMVILNKKERTATKINLLHHPTQLRGSLVENNQLYVWDTWTYESRGSFYLFDQEVGDLDLVYRGLPCLINQFNYVGDNAGGILIDCRGGGLIRLDLETKELNRVAGTTALDEAVAFSDGVDAKRVLLPGAQALAVSPSGEIGYLTTWGEYFQLMTITGFYQEEHGWQRIYDDWNGLRTTIQRNAIERANSPIGLVGSSTTIRFNVDSSILTESSIAAISWNNQPFCDDSAVNNLELLTEQSDRQSLFALIDDCRDWEQVSFTDNLSKFEGSKVFLDPGIYGFWAKIENTTVGTVYKSGTFVVNG